MKKQLMIVACTISMLLGTLLFSACQQSPGSPQSSEANLMESQKETPEPVNLEDWKGWEGTWAGIIVDDTARKAVMLELDDDGNIELLYCDDRKKPVESAGGTGLAVFTPTGKDLFQMTNWTYQTMGDDEMYPEHTKLFLNKDDIGDTAEYDPKTGMMISGRYMKGELRSAEDELLGELIILPLTYDLTIPPSWVWEAGVDEFTDGMLAIWSPWAQNVIGATDNIIVYTTESGEKHMRSAYGEVEYITDLNGDGIREIMIRSFLTELTDGITSDAPIWVTIFNLERGDGMLLDRSANNTNYYQDILIPSYQQEIENLQKFSTGYDEETVNSLIEGREMLVKAAEALYKGELLVGDRASVLQFVKENSSERASGSDSN